MTKLRQDAWSHEDDLLLAQTVLQHIRDGSTQLKAFEEVGDTLNRTSAACGFRWNAEVRQQYEQAVAIAKKQRKDSKRTMAHTEKPKLHTNLSLLSFEKEVPPVSHKESAPQVRGTLKMEDVITFLHNLGHSNTEDAQLQQAHELLSTENEALKNEHNQLQQRYDTLLEQYASIQEDYQSLMKIMDRARKLVLFDDPAERMAPIFKMDNNGSIEIVSQ